MDDGMSDVLGMTENDYYQITNYFIRLKKNPLS